MLGKNRGEPTVNTFESVSSQSHHDPTSGKSGFGVHQDSEKDTSDGQTSMLSGQFLLPEQESLFRQSTWQSKIRNLRIVGLTAAAFIVFGTLVDVLVVGNNSRLITIIVVSRALVTMIILVAILMADRWSNPDRGLDYVVVPPLMAISAMTCGMVWVIRGELLLHALTALVLVLVYYLFLPLSLRWSLAVSLAFSVFFLVSVCLCLEIRPDEFVQVVLYMTLVNVLGALVSREHNISMRREFTVAEVQRKVTDDLRNEMTARSTAEQARSESENRFRTLVEMSPNAIVVHRQGQIMYLNPTGQRLMGATNPEELLQQSFIDFVLPPFRQSILERLAQLSQSNESLPATELVVRTLDGLEVPCEVVSAPILYDGLPAVQSIIRDITERKKMQEELTRLATTDPLTGLCNRRLFFERLELEWGRARRHSRPLSILMFDLDHFKNINDIHGHAVGDSVLTCLSGEAQDVLRSEDILGRLGGEEFAVILPETDRSIAETIAERLRKRLAAVTIDAPEGLVRCTVSIGVIQCRLAHESLDVALKRADDALYLAKRSGRNMVCAG
jgi:diguanylate cyclase (GGDEF)-like protein/PAS domain S-box-containing protein